MQSPRLLQRLNQRNGKPERSWRAVLRSAFTKNLSLKVLSLLLAALMWAFIASQERSGATEFRFITPLVFKNIPSSLEVLSSPVQSVSVLVSVRRSLSGSLNPNNFQVAIDLSNQLPGAFEYTLSERNVTYDSERLPPSMSVLRISPSVVPVELEETIRREVPIKPRFSGDLSEGHTIQAIELVPPRVEVIGARSTVESLDAIYTRPLDVQDLDTDVEMLVELELPDSVRRAPGQEDFFRAHIMVSDNPMRLLLRDIPVHFRNAEHIYRTSTETVNVFLEGPRPAVEDLSREDVSAFIDMSRYPPGDYRKLTPQVEVPDSVRVLEQWPVIDLFVINRPRQGNGG